MSAATSGSATAVEGQSNSARQGGKMDKSTLIQALATQLKHERARGAALSAELEETEDVLNRKHDGLLALEAEYEETSRRNEMVIATLRRDLQKARQKLEEASHCTEVEASEYLALLQSSSPRPSTVRPRPSDPQPSFSREADAAFQSPAPPVLHPRSPERPRRTPQGDITPRPSFSARERTQERLKRLDERLAERELVASPSASPQAATHDRKASTTGRLGTQLTDAIGLGSSAASKEKAAPVIQSERRAEVPSLGVARSGSRLGKLFPTIGRK